ncbi:MAG: shikimate dehydrogenase [Patescibacteria group bacterium]|nr:shikimate dehydrogenase [Patescibacteria group bacterium]
MIIGDPVEHSISPQMHNACYKALGIDKEFIFLAAHVSPQNLEHAIQGIRALGIHAVTITIPHKTAVIGLLDAIDPIAEKIGAVNTIVNKNGKLTGFNTDWIGIDKSLKKIINLKNKKAAILGAGGAARAAICTAKKVGAQVYIFNRTAENAKMLAEEFQTEYDSIDKIESILTCDVIINTTSVGLNSDETPIPSDAIRKEQIVFDIIYTPFETQLLKLAKGKGACVIHGTDMLLYQAIAQFNIYTGRSAPEEVMRKAIIENL